MGSKKTKTFYPQVGLISEDPKYFHISAWLSKDFARVFTIPKKLHPTAQEAIDSVIDYLETT